LDNQPEIYGDR